MTELLIDKIEAPIPQGLQHSIGQILIVSDGEKLVAIDFSGYESRMMQLLTKRYGSVHLHETTNPQGFSDRLQAYLAGDFSSLDAIPVSTGGTPFQQQVWFALRSIPPGKTVTYGALAQTIGRPTAQRAVGMTNSLNPVAIVLPCHRVVGANANLTGYAGGLDRKRWLLQHEGAIAKS